MENLPEVLKYIAPCFLILVSLFHVRPHLEETGDVVPFTRLTLLNLGHRKISLVTRRLQCIHPCPSHFVLSEKDCPRKQRSRQRMSLSFQMSEKSETTFS